MNPLMQLLTPNMLHEKKALCQQKIIRLHFLLMAVIGHLLLSGEEEAGMVADYLL